MKKIGKIAFLMLLITIVTGCGNKSYMKEISYKKYHELLDNNETFILEIMRTDCSACISYKPKITQVANDYKIEIKYINTDHITEKEKEKLFDETGISGTPTVIFYENGVEETVSSRIVGSVSVDHTIAKFKANGIIND